jgi:hypothetical protein
MRICKKFLLGLMLSRFILGTNDGCIIVYEFDPAKAQSFRKQKIGEGKLKE